MDVARELQRNEELNFEAFKVAKDSSDFVSKNCVDSTCAFSVQAQAFF